MRSRVSSESDRKLHRLATMDRVDGGMVLLLLDGLARRIM